MIPFLGRRPLFFAHLPKTAGISFVEWLDWHFEPETTLALESLDAAGADAAVAQPEGRLFIHGHAPLDMRRAFPQRPFVFTLLRDPLERAVSAYHHLRRDAALPAMPVTDGRAAARARAVELAGRHDLGGFVAADPRIAAKQVGNIQTLMLSQAWGPGHFGIVHSLPPDTTADDLARACENLAGCDAFGVTERVPETAEMLAHALRLDPPRYPGWANRADARPPLRDIAPAALDRLREATAHDAALHRFATALFEDRRRAMMRDLLARHARQAPPAGQPPASASVMRFDRPVPGEGWYAPERAGDGWLSWTGPDPESWLLLRSPAGGGDAVIEVEVKHALRPEQIGQATLRVNDWPVAREIAATPDGHRLAARVPALLLRPPGEANRIQLTVTPILRPCDVLPASEDIRPLGLAISCVALRPEPPGRD